MLWAEIDSFTVYVVFLDAAPSFHFLSYILGTEEKVSHINCQTTKTTVHFTKSACELRRYPHQANLLTPTV